MRLTTLTLTAALLATPLGAADGHAWMAGRPTAATGLSQVSASLYSLFGRDRRGSVIRPGDNTTSVIGQPPQRPGYGQAKPRNGMVTVRSMDRPRMVVDLSQVAAPSGYEGHVGPGIEFVHYSLGDAGDQGRNSPVKVVVKGRVGAEDAPMQRLQVVNIPGRKTEKRNGRWFEGFYQADPGTIVYDARLVVRTGPGRLKNEREMADGFLLSTQAVANCAGRPARDAVTQIVDRIERRQARQAVRAEQRAEKARAARKEARKEAKAKAARAERRSQRAADRKSGKGRK